MMNGRIVWIGTLFLAGCLSTEQIAEKCAAYGFKAGTAQYGDCVMSLEQQNVERRQSFGAALSQASTNYGNNMRAIGQTSRPQNCTYQAFGSIVHQNCY